MIQVLLCLVIGFFRPVLGNSFIHNLPSMSATANIPASEMSALYDLFSATNGENWFWSEDTATYGIPWNFSDPTANNPCVDDWQGISCSFTAPFEYYHVTEIVLASYNLYGTMPDSLGNLSQLLYIGFDSNNVQGSIPVSLGNLGQLQCLSVYNNQLTGSIPESLGNLAQLQYLYLYNNQLSGEIPTSLGNITQVQYLYLYNNKLSGKIPTSLGLLSNLYTMYLADNYLSGTIPLMLGNLTQLQYLNLFDNLFTGEIPESLGNLTQLQSLSLYDNLLSNTVPGSLCQLSQLQYMYLYGNQLSGSIPTCLGDLRYLKYLYAENNLLSSTIPHSLSNLTQLQYLYLFGNLLNGTVPQSLGDLTQLLSLDLSINQLTGTMPDSFGNLSRLYYLNLRTNLLTGTIPESLGNLQQLQSLDLSSNAFSGTIPTTLGNLNSLLYLCFHMNQLHGSIPASLGNLIQLQSFQLDINHLAGVIPESIGNLTQLRYLNLGSNQFTGTIPESIGNLTQLQDIEFGTNKLFGTIPASLGGLSKLVVLYLYENELSGTIPYMVSSVLQQFQLNDNLLSGKVPTLSHISLLKVVLLHNNQLTGSLDYVFDPTTQLQVDTIVLANNQLTGTLPSAVIQLKLQTLVVTSNCFKGPLPIEAVCSNLNMVSFVIDGMGSASTCRHKLFEGPLSAYSLEHTVGGSIPNCLFQLPNITTLHLSGNGFTGSIPTDIQLSNTLSDLSISHNALTGSIPEQIQLKEWTNIDLSYNRLSGTLRSNIASNGSIELENNRISGTIPASFRTMTNLSVLGSNTFFCLYDESDLPEHDPNTEQYHCGSNSFDALFYVWLGAVVGTAVMACYNEKSRLPVLSILSNDAMLRITNLYNTLTVICRLSLCCALYSLVVLLPLYAICSVVYGTQTHAYAYQVSAVYMSGIVPFALDWCFWGLLLICFNAMLFYAPTVANTTGNKVTKYMQLPTTITLWQSMQTIVPYVTIDIIVVAGVNAAYVYVAVYKSSSLLLIVQTLLSIFKVVWGRWALPYLLTVVTGQENVDELHVFMQIVVNLLNNVAIPCLIVAVVSPNCFYNALVAAPVVTATVYYKECANALDNSCAQFEEVPLPTSYDPPFTYNFQCSSSLVTYYAPAFVSMCIVSTFVTPLAQYVCRLMHGRATPGTYWYKLLDFSLPRLAKPMQETPDVVSRGYLNCCRLLTTLISTLGLVLTFGVMFPPLCVAFTVSICATVLFFRYNVCKFVGNSSQLQIDNTVKIFQLECNSVDGIRLLKDSVWLLVTVSCWFYTLFLFDTLGDAVGFEAAYWVLIVMPLMPLALYALYSAVYTYYQSSYRQRHCASKEDTPEQKVDVEMKSIVTSSTDVHNVLVMGMAGDSIDNIVGSDSV